MANRQTDNIGHSRKRLAEYRQTERDTVKWALGEGAARSQEKSS